MPTGDDRLSQWQRNRSARLAAMPWLTTDTSTGRPVRYVAGEILVADAQVGAGHDVIRGYGHQTVADVDAAPGFRRLSADGLDVRAAVRDIRRRGAHESVAGPNHVFLSSPYEIGGPFGPPAPAVAAYTVPQGPAGTASARVAVVDTGVWRASPLPAACYQATDADYEDVLDEDADVGHANFITGVIMTATTNARVRIVKVLDADGVCTEAQLAATLLALPAVDVVNLSLGGFTFTNRPPVVLRFALDRLLHGQDRVVVAAAGNDGDAAHPFWPAAFSASGDAWSGQVVAVAAHDGTNVCDWSNRGPWVNIAAPGSNITSTYVTHGAFTDGLAQWSGTSFAAPRVVAAIAERHAATGSAADALKHVMADAATRTYGTFPGLA